MKKNITLTQSEFDELIYEAVQKERHMLFDMVLEDYALLPVYKERLYKGKKRITMTKEAWNRHLELLGQTLGDLTIARETIKIMEPVYKEFYDEYKEKHSFDLMDYMQQINFTYDSDEFERVRDKIEDTYYNRIDNDIER